MKGQSHSSALWKSEINKLTPIIESVSNLPEHEIQNKNDDSIYCAWDKERVHVM